jgi:hypothetical protein
MKLSVCFYISQAASCDRDELADLYIIKSGKGMFAYEQSLHRESVILRKF